MGLEICALNSGSNGNCYYVGNERDAVLIDAGISCRETERRLYQAGLDLARVRAVFISHEHTDHTRGVEVLSRKHGLPVYITGATQHAGRLSIDPSLTRRFVHGESACVGSLKVFPFRKEHDCVDPHSFTVAAPDGTTVGVFTDIGTVCDHLAEGLAACHAAFLESNYDERMLEEGPYPIHLKRRIRGKQGHLSNDQALEVFLWNRSDRLELVILSHLSAHNNHPELARNVFLPHANGTRIEVASRHGISGTYLVKGGG